MEAAFFQKRTVFLVTFGSVTIRILGHALLSLFKKRKKENYCSELTVLEGSSGSDDGSVVRAAQRVCVRAAVLREALRIKLLRARRRRAGRRVAGFVIMAQARLARRHAGRAVRSDTLLSTAKSIQRGDFPTRRAAAARAAPSTPRLMSAARVGPVVYGLLLTFPGDGYG